MPALSVTTNAAATVRLCRNGAGLVAITWLLAAVAPAKAAAEPAEYAPSTPITTRLWLLGTATLASPGPQSDARWDSAFGGGLMVLRSQPRTVVGGALLVSPNTSSDLVRIGGDVVLGGRHEDYALGFAAGPMVQLSPYAQPSWGGSIALWAMAGPILSFRVNLLTENATHGIAINAEATFALPLPAFALSRR